jgi:hypothetical protein
MVQPTSRGSSAFQVDVSGRLVANDYNVEALRRLWASRPSGLEMGPGVGPTGAWHVSCHLVAAGCVRRAADGRILWLEISHVSADDTYATTLTHGSDARSETVAVGSPEATHLENSQLLGFVEGTSEGHISARGVNDPPGRFGSWKRQDYDRPAGSFGQQGGRVWEHWCTTRDLTPQSKLSVSVLTAYLQLCNLAGDRFAPTVARGRTDYGHPDQLMALIDAGFTAAESARWQTTPRPIDREAELLLHEATPAAAFRAVRSLPWSSTEPTYFMYQRRISQWAG